MISSWEAILLFYQAIWPLLDKTRACDPSEMASANPLLPAYDMGFRARCRSSRRFQAEHWDCMLPFKLVYSDDYFLPIGSHVFPAEKYKRVHDQLLATGKAESSDFITPEAAS